MQAMEVHLNEKQIENHLEFSGCINFCGYLLGGDGIKLCYEGKVQRNIIYDLSFVFKIPHDLCAFF